MATVVTLIQLVRYSKLLLPVYLLIGTVTYLLMLRLVRAVEESDLNLLQGILGKRLTPLDNFLTWILIPPAAKSSHHCD